MRTLHLFSGGRYYGKESVILNLCSALENLGCSAEIGAFLNSKAPSNEVVIRAQNQRLRATAFACKGRIDFRTVKAIRAYIASARIDIVHTHDYKSDTYGFLATRVAYRPLFATCHNWIYTTVPLRIYAKIDRMILRSFQGVIAVSPQVGDVLQRSGVPRRKVAVIPNGIDLVPFLSGGSDCLRREVGSSLTIGIVGRLDHEKGHAVLFKAIAGILAQFPVVKLVVVGDGPCRAQLEKLAGELGIAASVYFAGYREDTANIYAALDLMVMPSLDEGMPMALLEAMASRRAVIASSVGAIPTVVKDGENGLLVRPGDVIDLQRALLAALNDTSLRDRLAANARASVARFSSEAMARSYLEFYQKVCFEGRSTAAS